MDILDQESDPIALSYSLSEDAQNLVTLSNDGTDLIITPNNNYNGSFSVFTSITESSEDNYSASTSFDVTITPQNDPPVIVDLPIQSGDEDSSISINLSATDIDGDSNFTFTITNIDDENNIVSDGTNRVRDLEYRLVELEGGDVSKIDFATTLGGDLEISLENNVQENFIKSFEFLLPATASEAELTDVIETLNEKISHISSSIEFKNFFVSSSEGSIVLFL